MNDKIKETMQRTYRYLYDDGLLEIAAGLLLLASALLFLPPTFSQMIVAEGIVAAVMLALLGRRLALTRFYLLALLALLLSGVIAGLQSSDLLGSALFLGLTGLLLTTSGLLVLRRYLQQHPQPAEEYA